MAKRIVAVIHDDWEIWGKGLGNVAHLQYLPSLVLMNIAREVGISLTFMVELGQQIAFLRFADKDANLGVQARLWADSVRLMRSNGFDVQPHIHPQWFQSRLEEGYIRVDGSWNLATYDDAARRTMIAECFAYLKDLLTPVDPDYSVNTFKAGAHGLQPSQGILADLLGAGVHIVMGPRLGMKTIGPEFTVDYSAMEEDTMPYCPDFGDLNRVGADRGLVILPMSYWDVDLSGKWHMILRKAMQSHPVRRRIDRHPYHRSIPESIRTINPRMDRTESAVVRKLLRPYRAGLNLTGPQPFAELRHILDVMVERLLGMERDTVPLVIESHSKDHEGNWDNLARFFRYMVERYGDKMEFMTMTQFHDYLKTNPSMIRRKP